MQNLSSRQHIYQYLINAQSRKRSVKSNLTTNENTSIDNVVLMLGWIAFVLFIGLNLHHNKDEIQQYMYLRTPKGSILCPTIVAVAISPDLVLRIVTRYNRRNC